MRALSTDDVKLLKAFRLLRMGRILRVARFQTMLKTAGYEVISPLLRLDVAPCVASLRKADGTVTHACIRPQDSKVADFLEHFRALAMGLLIMWSTHVLR